MPDSIKVKEILPGLIRGNDIMQRQNLRMSHRGRHINPYAIDWYRTDIRQFRVYQLPGRRNALGVVKFMFPNKHAIYLHDTPTKHLFKRESRAYIHGCMRVRNPLKLAEVLLGNDKGWGRRRINALVKRGPDNNEISLNKSVPVHVTYFTARITENDQIVMFDDVYDHEERIQLGLEGKAHLIVKRKSDLDEAGRQIVSDIGSSRYRSRRDRSWIERVFGN